MPLDIKMETYRRTWRQSAVLSERVYCLFYRMVVRRVLELQPLKQVVFGAPNFPLASRKPLFKLVLVVYFFLSFLGGIFGHQDGRGGVSLARDKGQGGQKNAPFLRGVWRGAVDASKIQGRRLFFEVVRSRSYR